MTVRTMRRQVVVSVALLVVASLVPIGLYVWFAIARISGPSSPFFVVGIPILVIGIGATYAYVAITRVRIVAVRDGLRKERPGSSIEAVMRISAPEASLWFDVPKFSCLEFSADGLVIGETKEAAGTRFAWAQVSAVSAAVVSDARRSWSGLRLELRDDDRAAVLDFVGVGTRRHRLALMSASDVTCLADEVEGTRRAEA